MRCTNDLSSFLSVKPDTIPHDSTIPILTLRLPRLLQSPQHILRIQRQFRHPRASAVVDRVGDAGRWLDAGDFAGAA